LELHQVLTAPATSLNFFDPRKPALKALPKNVRIAAFAGNFKIVFLTQLLFKLQLQIGETILCSDL
jgi:hypothetical protein